MIHYLLRSESAPAKIEGCDINFGLRVKRLI